MRLGEPAIQQLVHLLGATADQDSLRRRRDVRYRTNVQITIRPYGVIHPTPRTVTLLDFSSSGLAILDHMAMNPGARFMATLPGEENKPLSVLCEAKQSRLNTSGGFRISAAFADPEHAQRFVRGADGVIDESTIARNRPEQPATIRSAAGITDASIRGFQQGVFQVLGTQPLRIGEQFVLEIRHPDRAQAWRCTATAIEPAANDRFVITASVLGPAEPGLPPRASSGWLNWFKRR